MYPSSFILVFQTRTAAVWERLAHPGSCTEPEFGLNGTAVDRNIQSDPKGTAEPGSSSRSPAPFTISHFIRKCTFIISGSSSSVSERRTESLNLSGAKWPQSGDEAPATAPSSDPAESWIAFQASLYLISRVLTTGELRRFSISTFRKRERLMNA